jgi:hypothetical protein
MAMTLTEIDIRSPFKWVVVSDLTFDDQAIIDVWCMDNIQKDNNEKLWDMVTNGWMFVNKEDAMLLMLTFS